MKSFIVFAAVLSCAYAKPQFFYNGGFPFGHLGGHYAAAPAVAYSGAPALTYAAAPALTYAAAPAIIVPAFTKTQYHAQDELGQASYGYAHPGQSHAAVRDAFGNVRGSYAYIGADGKEVRVNYLADAVHGFQVESNALPVAPTVPVTEPLVAPLPVQDTAEVAEAKVAHLKAIEEAQIRNAEADKKDAADGQVAAVEAEGQVEPKDQPQSRRKRGIIAAPVLAYSTPLVHSVPTLTYSSHVVAAAPVVAYSSHVVHGIPALHYAAAPAVAYSNQIVHGGHAVTYAAAPAVVATQAVREATLTKVVNTPGHAVSYRVD